MITACLVGLALTAIAALGSALYGSYCWLRMVNHFVLNMEVAVDHVGGPLPTALVREWVNNMKSLMEPSLSYQERKRIEDPRQTFRKHMWGPQRTILEAARADLENAGLPLR